MILNKQKQKISSGSMTKVLNIHEIRKQKSVATKGQIKFKIGKKHDKRTKPNYQN